MLALLFQSLRVLRPELTSRRSPVANSVTGAWILDPQISVDSGGARVKPRCRPECSARRITPLRSIGTGIRAAAIAAGIDDGPDLAAEGALQLLAPGHCVRRPPEIRYVCRESAARANASRLERSHEL